MAHPNKKIIVDFYEAFSNKDYVRLQTLYHEDATFSDPVFRNLNAMQVRAMWEMLIRSGHDLKITFHDVKADDQKGSCRWEAYYTFSLTGRKVHNIIHASFEFRESKIHRHTDRFSFWRWAGMALGLKRPSSRMDTLCQG